ncbi:MAG: type III secretion system inner membrane ring subunit SctD [Kluyvera sp.]|uniref:type III secretion system inner membrane ring subunit SctD n=1 Tax=Kluyvera sp. TaxID=1538228 RepID=UPI003F36F995
MNFTLKILNGVLQGRELALPTGPLTLGLGDVDLQVALDDGLTLITLLVGEQDICLQSPVPCWIEGRTYQGERLPTGKIIDLAGVAIVLLGPGESYTPRRIPERLAPGRWRMSRVQRQILRITVSSVVLLSACIAFYWWQHQETVSEQFDRLGVEQWLAKQHQTPDLRTLGFEWLGDGTVRIYGECRKQNSLDNVLQILRGKGVFWHLETRCQDRLQEDVRDLLSQNGYQHVELLSGKSPGEIRIRGNIRADERWDRVVHQLSELPGLKRWSVVSSESSKERWLTTLRKAGFIGRVNMERRDDRLIVSGQLSDSEQLRLQQTLKTLLKEDHLSLIFQNIPPRSTDGDDIFPLPVASIGGSKLSPYLTLTDGRRLQIGATLNQGYEIAGIDPQRGVDVYRDGQLLHIALAL